MTVDAVVKLGGSLLDGVAPGPLLEALGALARTKSLVVVPGGGPFADAVREACGRHASDESTAHWMAILAMDQHAHLLAGLQAAADVVVDAEGVRHAVGAGRLAVLAPFAWLRAADPLPHGWHVTSDSIAAWVAGQVGARRLILLKALDGVPDGTGGVAPDVSLDALVSTGIVDAYFAHAADTGVECWILNGREPERLTALLRDGRATGTRVRSGPGRRAGRPRARR